MFVAETALLQAVRDQLITDLDLSENQCDVELDDQLPAIAKNDYYAVTAAGLRAGPRHESSGGVFDLVISVRVTLYRRIPQVARDRRRNVFLDLLKGSGLQLERVIRSLDYSYPLLARASTLVQDIIDNNLNVPVAIQANSLAQWPEPFRTFTPDTNYRIAVDAYDPAKLDSQVGDPIIALARGVTFSGARYMQVRT